ncbi:thiamine pyrophosphate-dependent enzyme [Rubrimonas cliftonensis]|uniref:Thiamine pyrophosphate enzyme, C-terminal TPP binding domain n=1 Tax=Rubrimonas cliftonensis TaxID=89524 RepID=A0A1H4E8G7_9RHOB|nr:thiamine pyrophosphate-dependent enzyme [Rubrimonas cliftonensis]SEA81089.1 Thiamine pyrophosphate enzyme, C-terminal TPP binding domain [Rubrimonas cliftonensis]
MTFEEPSLSPSGDDHDGSAFPTAAVPWVATRGLAAPAGRRTVSISGDGGVAPYAMEVTAAFARDNDVAHGPPNNAQFGKIAMERRPGRFRFRSADPSFRCFAAATRLCGGVGATATGAALGDPQAAAFAAMGPALLEILCDAELA